MRRISWLGVCTVLVAAAAASSALAAETAELLSEPCVLKDARLQRDFPDMCLDSAGNPWVAYIEHDGKADVLRLAKRTDKGLENVAQLAGPGVLHPPAIACDGSGAIWCFWGQLGPKDVVNLYARRFSDGKPDAPVVLAESAGSDTFAAAGTDHAGRVWVVWQSMRAGHGNIYTRYLDPKSARWSAETAVSTDAAGDWEPRVAFDGRDGAWVVFDSSRGNEFNLYLAHVDLDGQTETKQLTNSPEYEGRASIAAATAGKGFWIAAERGREGWGKNVRAHGGQTGLNGQKRVLFGYYNIAAGTFTEMPPATAVLAKWVGSHKVGGPATPKARPAAKPNPQQPALAAVNLPQVVVDADENPWIACRYYPDAMWHLAIMKFDAAARAWSEPVEVRQSTFCQDRHCQFVRGADGKLWLCWPSDGRVNKNCGVAGVFLAHVDPKAAPPSAHGPEQPVPRPAPTPYLNPATPQRPRSDHHVWTFAEQKYGLYWGDLHRHTDVSVCITPHDGCVLEQFRYAYDMANLDFLGTSDHTDHGKTYAPYEWWHNQRLVDVFYVPGVFNSLYAYEREQKWPWGHRNVIFAQRGGPMVYINRLLYRNSASQAFFPAAAGKGEKDEILPAELWQILRKYAKPVTTISHTGATGMGTDWEIYQQIDNAVENLVEIYQGARVSYEGPGTPQPTVGLRGSEAYNTGGAPANASPPQPITDFGKFGPGVYRNALRQGHKLGVFASSDHISQHVSFGGVYTEKFTREGIIEALNARHTIAATDKIYLEFSCNGRLLGSIFDTDEKPQLKISANGTATIKRVTVIRNEADYKTFEHDGRDFAVEFTDDAPLAGENRYYIRVEQNDGNMAWSSPVWVTFKKN